MEHLALALAAFGLLALVAGVALVYVPAAFIVGGLALLWCARSVALEPSKPPRSDP